MRAGTYTGDRIHELIGVRGAAMADQDAGKHRGFTNAYWFMPEDGAERNDSLPYMVERWELALDPVEPEPPAEPASLAERIGVAGVSWRATFDAMQERTAGIRAELAEIQDRLSSVEGPFRDTLAKIEAELYELTLEFVRETDERPEAEGVILKFTEGYTRSTWDGKALEGYAKAHPEILELKRQSFVKPRLNVQADV